MNRRWAPFIIVAIVATTTFTAGALLYRINAPQSRAAGEMKSQSTSGDHVRGNKDALVTIEEFGDLECPPCAALAPIMKKIEEEFHGKVRVVFRHFPLINHVHSRDAAYAAEAAAEQGHFWEMHDLLYQQQSAWNKAPDVPALFASYARVLGLDVTRFEKDRQAPTVRERVTADQDRAKARGVEVTPSVFVNGHSLEGPSLNESGLRAAILAALSAEPKS